MTQCKWFAAATCTDKCDNKFCDVGATTARPAQPANSAATVEPAASHAQLDTQGGNAGGADFVNHPPHYTAHPSGIECIQVTRLCAFDMGNAIKYVWRYPDKNGIQDLDKARWYLQDVVTSGQSWYLPYKARELLTEVLESENDEVRLAVFTHLVEGRAHEALAFLNGFICAGERGL